jgi:predicted NACHT family NTPase
LGGPGAGKTTLLKHVGLQALAGDAATDLTTRPDVVPVFIRLAKLSSLLAKEESAPALIARFPPQVQLGTAPSFFQEALRDGRCLLLLDGLDEAATRAHTAEVSRWVESVYNAFPQSRIVLSSRYAGYHGESVLRVDHRVVSLRPLGDDEIPHFLRRWYESIEAGAGDEAANRAAQLADSLAGVLSDPERADLRSLAGTPLMLLIMALLHRLPGYGLPDRRVQLYNLCVDVLLEYWNKEQGRDYIPAELGRAILRPLAFWLHGRPGRYSATLDEILPVIEPELERTPQLPERDPRRFLEWVRDRAGLFTGQSEHEYAFLHPTFQEFLAAEHVLREPGARRKGTR